MIKPYRMRCSYCNHIWNCRSIYSNKVSCPDCHRLVKREGNEIPETYITSKDEFSPIPAIIPHTIEKEVISDENPINLEEHK